MPVYIRASCPRYCGFSWQRRSSVPGARGHRLAAAVPSAAPRIRISRAGFRVSEDVDESAPTSGAEVIARWARRHGGLLQVAVRSGPQARRLGFCRQHFGSPSSSRDVSADARGEAERRGWQLRACARISFGARAAAGRPGPGRRRRLSKFWPGAASAGEAALGGRVFPGPGRQPDRHERRCGRTAAANSCADSAVRCAVANVGCRWRCVLNLFVPKGPDSKIMMLTVWHCHTVQCGELLYCGLYERLRRPVHILPSISK